MVYHVTAETGVAMGVLRVSIVLVRERAHEASLNGMVRGANAV